MRLNRLGWTDSTQACAALEAMTFALLQDLQDSASPAAAASTLAGNKAGLTAWSQPTRRLSGSPAAASVAGSSAGEGGGVPTGVGNGDGSAAASRSPPGDTPPEAVGAAEERPAAILSR